ncbi:protein of unknown function [Nitrospira japonica]|uniref:Uncharacterized protein n=1 Tax=Nitrospira japonica TaxID=1325564 RepID=A0A1W1I4Z4_9BACT|nr:protein of unknown function [Nitrospira japonica]
MRAIFLIVRPLQIIEAAPVSGNITTPANRLQVIGNQIQFLEEVQYWISVFGLVFPEEVCLRRIPR